MAPSPVVARWELSRRLATRRKELGVDVETITTALDFTRNYWSAVENDRTLIAEGKLRALFDLLQFEPQDQQELLDLREESRVRGWWEEVPGLFGEVKRFIGLEDGAVRIRAYEGNTMPGLLQTTEYTQAIIEGDPFFRPVDIEQALSTRSRRQHLLDGTSPTEFVAILSEGAIRQQVGPADAHARQLRHICDLAASPRSPVTIHALPFDVNPGIIANSSTLLFFDFGKRHLPTIAWQEAVRPLGIIEEEHDQFKRLAIAWEDGLQRTLDGERSLRFILAIADELDRSD
jgi:hypothetical protein